MVVTKSCIAKSHHSPCIYNLPTTSSMSSSHFDSSAAAYLFICVSM